MVNSDNDVELFGDKKTRVFHVSETELIGLNIANIVRIRKEFVLVFNAVEPQFCCAGDELVGACSEI